MSTIRWTGGAPVVAQVNTIVVGGTPATGQIYTVTINGKSVSYSALNTDTNTTIATGLYNALIASTVPKEFQDVTWSNPSAGTVLGTSATAGKPFTQTSSASGTGTLVTTAGIAQPSISSTSTATSGGTLNDTTTYYYKLTAINAAGETQASAEANRTTGNSGSNVNTITLNWSAPAGTGISGYKIYRGTASNGEVFLATVGAGTASYVDTGTATGSGAPPTVNTTVSSGPNDISCPLNYSGSVLPVNGDTLIVENTSQGLLYNLSTLSGVTLTALYVNASFTGQAGLPKVNPAGYFEYRPDYLQVGATSIYVGRGGSGTGSGRVKIDTGSVATTIYLDGAGNSTETGVPSFLWKGTSGSNNVYATKGQMGAAWFGGEAATISTLDVGFQTNRAGDVTFQGGTGLTWTTLNQSGGQVTLQSGGTTVTQTGGTLTQREGSITTANVKDDRGSQPTFVYNGAGTITTLNAAGKVTVDLSQSQRACTITNASLYGPVKWLDPYGNSRTTLTNGLLLSQTGLGMDDGPSVNRGRNYTMSFS